jgi:hypothetical protein
MGSTSSMMGEMGNLNRVLLTEPDHFQYMSVGGRIILKWMLEK